MNRPNPLLSPTGTLFQLAILSWVICSNLNSHNSDHIYPNHYLLYSTHSNHYMPSTMHLKHHTVSLSKQCTVPLAPKAPLPSSKYLSAVKNISSYILLIIIATSSDIELNPGPPQIKHPCGTCGKAVTWRQKGIRCDNPDCEQWYHIACQNMRPTIYEHMNSSNCVWECLQCALPNYSSSLFDLHSISTSNSFSNLDSSTEDSQEVLSPGLPLASSSPHKKAANKETHNHETASNYKCKLSVIVK